MSDKKTVPMSLRLSLELDARLKECAARLRQKKHSLAQEAIEAAVEAIEKNGYRLVVPIEFEVVRVPIEKTGAKISYRSLPQEISTAEERAAPKRKTGT